MEQGLFSGPDGCEQAVPDGWPDGCEQAVPGSGRYLRDKFYLAWPNLFDIYLSL